MFSRLSIAPLVLALLASLALIGCSDTRCHDTLAPDGGLVQSDNCVLVADGDDAGTVDPGTNNVNGGNNGADVGDPGEDASDPDDAGTDAEPGEDVTVQPDADNTNNGTPSPTLVGDWISQGQDVAPILRQGGFEVEALTVTFGRDGSYVGELRLASGDVVPYGGTFVVDDGTDPWGIALTQTAPQGLTSQGIVAVEEGVGGLVMRFEVVQVDPPTPGFQPPTPQGGFGSTRGTDHPADNIQVYRRP